MSGPETGRGWCLSREEKGGPAVNDISKEGPGRQFGRGEVSDGRCGRV